MKLDANKQNQVLAVLSVGGSRTLAAQYVGCHPRTIYNLAKSDPEFGEKLRVAEASPEYHMLKTVVSAAKEGAVKAAQWGLRNVYQDRYGTRKPYSLSRDGVRQVLEDLILEFTQAAPDAQTSQKLLTIGSRYAQNLLGEPLDIPLVDDEPVSLIDDVPAQATGDGPDEVSQEDPDA